MTLDEAIARARALLADNDRLVIHSSRLEDKLEAYESKPPDVYRLGVEAGAASRDEEISALRREIHSLKARLETEGNWRVSWRNEAMRLYGALKHARHVIRFAKKPSAWPKLDEFLHKHVVRYKEVRRTVEPQFVGRAI